MNVKLLISHLQNVFTLSRCAALLLCSSILFIAFWIRIQGVDRIPDKQFTDTDGYFFYDQAQLIAEHGTLPDRDMSRWVPIGKDLTETLPFYGYVLAYSHKVIAWFFPIVSLYHVCVYMPTVCFILGLGVLMFFFYYQFGFLFSSIIGVLLATLPGAIDRSAAGFGDRDSWCLLIGILAITTYLQAHLTQHSRHRLYWTLASSLSVCIGGLSWVGFSIFLVIIMSVELWRFLTAQTEEGLGYYAIWTLTFVPLLVIGSPVYRGGGGGFTTHLFTIVIIPPLTLLAIRTCRYLLLTKSPFSKHLLQHSRNIAFILSTITLTIAFFIVLTKLNTFDTLLPFSQNRLMQSIGELQSPNYKFWYIKYGGVFLCGSIGFLLTSIHPRNRIGHILLALPLSLFILTTFYREPVDVIYMRLFDTSLDNILFFLAVGSIGIGFLIHAWQRKTHLPKDILYVAFCAWFFYWVALARDANRYDFFIGVAIVFFTAVVIHTLAKTLSEKITKFQFTPTFLKSDRLQSVFMTSIAVTVLSLFLFWSPAGAHTRWSRHAAVHFRNPLPGNGPMGKTIKWIANTLEKTDVVAANWEYGNQLNVLGGVKTIIGPDHYRPHWIHLFFRHVYAAQSENEALEFLYTHEATHLMFNQREVLNTDTFSEIGSDIHKDRFFNPKLLQLTNTKTGKTKYLINTNNTLFNKIDIELEESPLTLTAHTKDGQKITLPYVAFIGYLKEKTPNTVDGKNGGVVLYLDSRRNLQKAYYLSPIGWNSLIVRLYIRGEPYDAFEPIYTQREDIRNQKDVRFDFTKIWKIRYPSNIKQNPKYLATAPTK